MRVESVNTLEDNRPQYRLGDAVLIRHTRGGQQAFDFVATNPRFFEGSVLYEYASRIDRTSTEPQWEVLREVVSERTRGIGFDLPQEDELVIHLRMGDHKGFKLPAEALVNYVLDLIHRIDPPISQLTVVTAIHYGKLLLEKQQPEEVATATAREVEKLQEIIDRFSARGKPVRLYSHQDVDRDFCFLANARRLVLGNGHFSLCAAVVSSAECFVPPWVQGVRSKVHEDLLARQRKVVQASPQ